MVRILLLAYSITHPISVILHTGMRGDMAYSPSTHLDEKFSAMEKKN
jgi:hypothetical protein